MKQISTVIVIMLIIFSCSTKSKKEDLEKIERLEKEITNQKYQIQDRKVIIEKLKKANNESLEQVKESVTKLKRERDSISKLYKIARGIDATVSNMNSEYAKVLNYKITSDDKYWKRGAYYTSEKKGEYLYNVRTSIINNHLRFYFMGVQQPFDIKNPVGTIYELDENKKLHVIDTINLLPKINSDSEYQLSLDKETHLQEFMLLQMDNLIVKDGRLYYYKINELDKTYFYQKPEKEFYEYLIGTKTAPRKINTTVFSNTIVESSLSIYAISPDKTKVVDYWGEELNFFNISDWKNDSQIIFSGGNLSNNLSKIDFDLKQFFKYYDDDLYGDPDHDKDVLLFGGVCWHTRKNILYFDNSGMMFRCIWQIDFDKNKVTKIVPEHEAIHPYFFEIKTNEYVAYVEKNKIMICESPDNN
ncbi:hypothetical protein [Tenacibaculum jejuense]|uniref:Lipoprotein n=1 Tax=Tenacibaculum jejuense TaxID=584609 RepID=A0A238UCT0_9FLAO|nr:hypothetical protein [Tenacibaculum jejuense]SNR16865.1 protein of unknown function [Tenacibaculum jejuense]